MKCLPEASRTYFSSVVRGKRQTPFELTPELIKEIEAYREQVRVEEGGGGMCHIVSDYLSGRFGWERLYVSYLNPDGQIICGGAHVINILNDGSILDATRDQFGEGFSVSHISVASSEIGRYRPEFYEDYYPGHPDAAHLSPWLPFYDGTCDADVDTLKGGTREDGWWLTDRSLYEEYKQHQHELSGKHVFKR